MAQFNGNWFAYEGDRELERMERQGHYDEEEELDEVNEFEEEEYDDGE